MDSMSGTIRRYKICLSRSQSQERSLEFIFRHVFLPITHQGMNRAKFSPEKINPPGSILGGSFFPWQSASWLLNRLPCELLTTLPSASLVPRPSTLRPFGKLEREFSEGAWCGGSGDETSPRPLVLLQKGCGHARLVGVRNRGGWNVSNCHMTTTRLEFF